MDPMMQYAQMRFENKSKVELEEFLHKNNIDLTQTDSSVQKMLQDKINKIDEQLKNANLQELDQAQLHADATLSCIKAGNYDLSMVHFDKIGQKSISQDILFDFQIAVMRYAVATNQPKLYEKHLLIAEGYKGLSFDNLSQTQVYRAVYILLFSQPTEQKVQEVLPLLTMNISTFTAEQLMPFNQFVILAFATAICKLSRKELQSLIDKQMDNYQIVIANPACKLLLELVNCEYQNFIKAVESLIQSMNADFYMNRFSNTLADLFKAKIYDQYLKTFNSVQLSKVSKDLGVNMTDLIDELEYFIFNQQLKAKINGTSLVKVNEDKCTEQFLQFYDAATKLVGRIEVAQRK